MRCDRYDPHILGVKIGFDHRSGFGADLASAL
jgi:hypothetical protein